MLTNLNSDSLKNIMLTTSTTTKENRQSIINNHNHLLNKWNIIIYMITIVQEILSPIWKEQK